MKKTLSIIIPVYNTEKYLRNCLESVLIALPDDSEIILVNDGSTDRSEKIISEFLREYPNSFTYYSKPNGGLSDVKNFALERAQGKYITFVDSDDQVEPNIYYEMLDLLGGRNGEIALCDFDCIYEKTGHHIISACTNAEHNDELLMFLDTPLMASSCNKMVSRELYEGLTFPVGLNNEDVAVTPIILARSRKNHSTGKASYKYMQRFGSIQNSGFDERRLVLFDTVRLAISRSQELPHEAKIKIEGVLFIHQILAVLMYPIRELPAEARRPVIMKYIDQCHEKTPEMFSNDMVARFIKSGGVLNRIYKGLVFRWVKNREAERLTFLFSVVNTLKNLIRFVKR
jgi:glycosyltransferase involved in cell wall biosynthesis